ncbi:aspartyl-phosphate phosphatase Spo0E family protein [Amphibacillus sp. Q70]|uniref:aspartyl-phosphate phosphatase Spo0E family protein n=1 Tax=Amphibacillus sp. Q70 TaxID=3453416 RepID=UPI003F82514D
MSQFTNASLLLKTTPEIEQLRNEMYQRYIETNDPKALVEISQKLDQVMNQYCFSNFPNEGN